MDKNREGCEIFMIIGIDSRTLMDERYSGVSEFTSHILREILRLDKKNSYKLFYNSWRDREKFLPDFLARDKREGTNFELIKSGYPNKIFNYGLQKPFSYPQIDKILGGVDLFFAPHFNFTSLSSNCRKLITIHDLSFLRHKEFFSWRKNFWHKMVNVRKMVRGFDRIIAVSEHTKKDIMDLCGVPEEKIEVIYHGVSDRFRIIGRQEKQEEFADLKKKYNLPEKFMLYLGTVEPRKNVSGLISAYEIFRDRADRSGEIKLVIAGQKGWKTNEIERKWKNSKYRSDIAFLGYITPEEKPYLYNSAFFFVYPSFYEGFGMPILEAMASGLPVISSNSSSMSEIVSRNGILVNPYDINEIALSMLEIFSDKELRRNLRERGPKRAREFSWEKAAGKYLDIFLGQSKNSQ